MSACPICEQSSPRQRSSPALGNRYLPHQRGGKLQRRPHRYRLDVDLRPDLGPDSGWQGGTDPLDLDLGRLALNPLGSVIEQATVLDPSSGGQSAVVGSATPFGDYEAAGAYFVEVSGTSGSGAFRLAVDGNVTTLAVPEPSTWAMMLLGFAGLGAAAYRSTRRNTAAA
jgi:hypothetical protein